MSNLISRLNAALEGRYRVERMLGEGGMAMVFLAEDLKHRRSVALKVLRPELAAVVGVQRFLTEIETTASLHHPHILPLFDSGEADGFLFYVMPYVAGDSLRERLESEHQLPVDEALVVADKIAAALQYAHEQGIVHRDIKPANVLLSRGEPLVSDFGIALALSEAGGGRITKTGLSMGTPHYMSPEQAAGERTVDKRTDVYALGCVLYEMLTGQPPHSGATAQAVLGAILTADPTPLTEQRKSIPAHVEHAVLAALSKLPADRFESVADFASALKDRAFRRGPEAGTGATLAKLHGSRWRRAAIVATVIACLLAGVQIWTLGRGAGESDEVRRQRILLGNRIEEFPGRVSQGVALAPDGSGILFADSAGAGAGRLFAFWWKEHDESDAIRVPNMDDALAPVFSPDGEWLAYVVGGQLRKQPLRGGTTVLLADGVAAAGAQALAWLDDGTLVFENSGPLLERISENGGPRDTIASLQDVGFPIHVNAVIGGGAILVSSCTDASCSRYRLSLVDFERDTIAPLADDVLRAWNVEDDLLVYVDRSGAVFGGRLKREEASLEPPFPLFGGVATVGTVPTTAEIQVGRDGTLLYRRGGAAPTQFRVVWVDREGRTEPVDPSWGRDDFVDLSLSPGGDRLAVTLSSQIWVKELPDGPLTQVTIDVGAASRPDWTPDGDRISYIFTGGGVADSQARIVRADGSSSAPDTLLAMPDAVYEVIAPAAAGWLVARVGTGGAADLAYAEVERDSGVEWLVDSEASERAPALSPDGRWLAYVSNLSGRDEVYVRPFPDTDRERITISTSGGSEPAWAHSGRELFYRDGRGWMTVARVSADSVFQVEAREPLFDAWGFGSSPSHQVYDVAPDDRRFVMLQLGDTGGSRGSDLILVENWVTELREALGR